MFFNIKGPVVGAKPDMLRKYLVVVGFGAIIFGILFFVLTMIATFSSLDELNAYREMSVSGREKRLMIMYAVQTYGFAMFEGLTLGGICLYLAHKI